MKAEIGIPFWVVLVAAAVLLWGAPARAGVSDVKVTTDRSIDCSSIQTIARDLYKDCKTEEEKAIATWYFVRRLHFHWPHIPTWDSIDLINSYGIALCGYQSNMYCQIANAGGLKARTMHPQAHVIAEAFYDGAWHMFDCQVGWYARNRKGAVASCAEMKADPTLVTEAVKEGRASKPYFQCRDDPGGGTNYAATARRGGMPKPPTNRLVINLRRGESITRAWANEAKPWFQVKDNRGFVSPQHGCTAQVIDQNDPVNWPYWKPYAQVRSKSGEKAVYGIKRYYGNGRMAYEPDLAGAAFMEGLGEDGLSGVAAKHKDGQGPNLHPATVGKAGSVTFVINCPYVVVDAWLDAAALRQNKSDVLAVHAKSDRGKWQEVYRADATGKLDLKQISLKPAVWARHRYFVKFELSAGAKTSDVGLESLKLTTVFVNNMYALPYFMPGKNTVKVAAAEGAELKTNKLTLEYVWEEEGRERKLAKTIEKLPFEATVSVSGKELPRMKSVKLAVAP
jgi:hypothetical protein